MFRKMIKFDFIAFICAIFIFGFLYGFLSCRYQFFPYIYINQAKQGLKVLLQTTGIWEEFSLYITEVEENLHQSPPVTELMADGLTLITGIGSEKRIFAKLIDKSGTIIHEWEIDWFKLWPDADHIPERHKPKSRPGTHIHGVVLMDNGDLIFNFERCGLIRLSKDNEIVWKLPYQTHHSLYIDENSDLWVSGQIERESELPAFPSYKPYFPEFMILKVSQQGKILKEISVFKLLQQNELHGLLYMGSLDNLSTSVSGDTLHLNDVETFPSSMEEGFFKHGDFMISLRNINAILVFDKQEKHKFTSIGRVVRQHDPDFIDGNTISVYDNNNVDSDTHYIGSRIVRITVPDDTVQTMYAGTVTKPFFSSIMGKHQVLANGNTLITESLPGRAFEITRAGRIVWEYFNFIDKNHLGLIDEAQRVSSNMRDVFE